MGLLLLKQRRQPPSFNPASMLCSFSSAILLLLLGYCSASVNAAMSMGDHRGLAMHQQRRSASLEELVNRRNTRSFPYSAVSYLRMLPQSVVPNPHLIFSPSSTNSLAQLSRGNHKQRLLLTQPEIVELIDLIDSLESPPAAPAVSAPPAEETAEEDASDPTEPLVVNQLIKPYTTTVDRERRSAGPVLKRYACRFKFCRIFDA